MIFMPMCRGQVTRGRLMDDQMNLLPQKENRQIKRVGIQRWISHKKTEDWSMATGWTASIKNQDARGRDTVKKTNMVMTEIALLFITYTPLTHK